MVKNFIWGLLAVLLLIALSLAGYIVFFFQPGLIEVEREWQSQQPSQLLNFGSTKTLSILPLVNWNTLDSRFKGEAGVSYLIKTDQQTILFDVGFNAQRESPSPLQHNMAELGIALNEIDTLFLSHHHLDHSGGQSWVNKNTFSLGNEQVDLTGMNIFSPVAIEYPNVDVQVIPDASIVGPGLASIGAISRQLFMGRIAEQALAINVEGKGLVLIVGCGHQTLAKILQRTAQVFDQPLYGLVGDLHYPVPEGRLELLGFNLQRIFASGSGPFQPIEQETINTEMAMLKELQPSLVALGSHDTSYQVIHDFSQAFGNAYRYVSVGEWINIDNK
jgi:7,8-dihydropterin-6-yl-methyl-4-(beta-D-ribofuranosyl)aminobenzene 5'-phosphate synthase